MFQLVMLLAGLGTAAGCSTSAEERPLYQAARPGKALDVPPDLTRPAADQAVPLPDLAPQRVELAGGGAQDPVQARVARDGSLRWLEIDAPANVVWPQAKTFLRQAGFELAVDAPRLGILETEWKARDRNSGGVLGRLLGGGTVAGVLDRYRVRLERGAREGTSLLYLTHRGLHETGGGEARVWEERGPDPEREAEMLQRLLVFLGTEAGAAQASGATTDAGAELRQEGGAYLLRLDEAFARAWRRTGLALDRMGVVVTDRDRSAGVFFIRLPDSFIDAQGGKGWLAKVFAGGDAQARDFRIAVEGREGGSQVRVLDGEGKPAPVAFSQQILARLREHLS